MKAKKKQTKKRNPTDATLRNIRALKKRVAQLELEIRRLHQYRDAVFPAETLLGFLDEPKKKGKK